MLQFISSIAWPVVALIGLLILGPGKVIERSISGIADKLLSIKSSIDEFKKITEDFNERQRQVQESLAWLRQANGDLDNILAVLTTVKETTNEIAEAQIVRQLSDALADDPVGLSDDNESRKTDELTPSDRYRVINEKWGKVTERIKRCIGEERFDGRSIRDMASALSHRGRADAISKQDAELIGNLHSQYKRFVRMRSSLDEWLSPEIYDTFMRGADRALRALNQDGHHN